MDDNVTTPAQTHAIGVPTMFIRTLPYAAVGSLILLGLLVWFAAPDWSGQTDVTAPLTRNLLFVHPAAAWAAFLGYGIVFWMSVRYLNRPDPLVDMKAATAAEVGFLFNTIALLTGTVWGAMEWVESGQNALATVYSEPKVLVVLVTWFTFGAYLSLRRVIDSEPRRARLSAVFGILGGLGVPFSFATSRLISTSLHPDVAGPGSNPDAALGAIVGGILAWSAVAFTLLFLVLYRMRLEAMRWEDQIVERDAAVGA